MKINSTDEYPQVGLGTSNQYNNAMKGFLLPADKTPAQLMTDLKLVSSKQKELFKNKLKEEKLRKQLKKLKKK